MIRPIFVLCLPRSGSTMMQRLLSSHHEVETVAEPWVLLPFFTPLENRTTYSEYGHMTLHKAFNDILDVLPGGLGDYYEMVQASALMLYEKMASGDARYFVDKTPRYHFISQHVVQAFSEAKLIFLWRNPLAVAASLFTMSSERGSWKDFHRYKVDIYRGFENLNETYSEFGERGLSIRYEDIVAEPDLALDRLGDFLDLQFPKEALDAFSSYNLRGTLGDQTSAKVFEGISTKSLDKWETVLNFSARRRWAIQYLQWLGDERLLRIGYDPDTLMRGAKSLRPSKLVSVRDWIEYVFYTVVYSIFDPTILKHKIHQVRRGERTYPLY